MIQLLLRNPTRWSGKLRASQAASGTKALSSSKPTRTGTFCVSALEEALARFGKPEQFTIQSTGLNQGSQSTSAAFKGYADGRDAKAGIAAWIAFYNVQRPHQALGNRTPMAVWRAGITGAIDETSVDRTLRLGNARAWPTYPQPQQQQKALVA
ncbi:MAG: transposase [Azospirillum sp.]|nr:transposase [Azospirillum sp.]